MNADRDDEPRRNAPQDKPSQPAEDAPHERATANPNDSRSESPLQESSVQRDDESSTAGQASQDSAAAPSVPLPDFGDLSDPVFGLGVSALPSDDVERASSTDSGGGLSEEKANELIKMIEDGLAELEASPETISPDKLEGIVLRFVKGADSAADDKVDAAATADADRRGAASAPGGDEASRDIDRFAGGLFRRGEPAGDAPAGSDHASAMPRIIIVVELADARAIMQEDRRESAQEMAAMLGEIAASEVRSGFWHYENQQRAADYRLRGPSW